MTQAGRWNSWWKLPLASTSSSKVSVEVFPVPATSQLLSPENQQAKTVKTTVESDGQHRPWRPMEPGVALPHLKQQFLALTRCLRRRRPPPRASVTGGDDDLDAANAREDSGKNLSTVTGDRSCFPFHLLLLAFTRSTVHSKQRQRVLKTLPVTTNTCFYYRKGLGFGGEQSSLSLSAAN